MYFELYWHVDILVESNLMIVVAAAVAIYSIIIVVVVDNDVITDELTGGHLRWVSRDISAAEQWTPEQGENFMSESTGSRQLPTSQPGD